jgi:hypothetical protein
VYGARVRLPWVRPRGQEWLVPLSEPGSRTIRDGFIARHPALLETSETSAQRGRLDLRYEAIFGDNADALVGARVLDIASHDGRWSLAAIRSGATHVTGIEARDDLVAHAVANFERYDVDPTAYRFVTGDVLDVLGRENLDVDVALCLGFLYHSLRYNELFSRIRDTGARTLIVDTLIWAEQDEPGLRLFSEPTERQGNAVADAFSFADEVLVGRPSYSGLLLMATAYGFHFVSRSDWGGLLRDNPSLKGVRDYREGRRVTVRFQRDDAP